MNETYSVIREQLFLRQVEELKSKSAGGGYDFILASAIIRQFLIDGTPLIVSMNQKYKLKIRFTIHKPEFKVGQEFYWRSLIPFDNTENIEVHLSEFVNTVMIKHNEFEYTVRDAIHYSAHILGGVHSLTPSNPKDIEYDNIQIKYRRIMGAALTTHAMSAITQIMLTAIEPLVDKIKQHTPTGGF